MNRRGFRGFLAGVGVFFLVVSIHAGGWAVVTVEKMPDYFLVGQPATLIFTARQHGLTPMTGADIQVKATSPGRSETVVTARPTGKPGEYRADLIVSAPGEWTVSVNTGLFGIAGLLPMRAIRIGELLPPPLSQIAHGERLFVSKGCIGCHVNNEIPAKNLTDVGPDLTGRKFPVDYLRKVLSDPDATLKKEPGQTWSMPNLNLKEEEIAALTAFINRTRPNGAVSKR